MDNTKLDDKAKNDNFLFLMFGLQALTCYNEALLAAPADPWDGQVVL